jgi:hypothetical protein
MEIGGIYCMQKLRDFLKNEYEMDTAQVCNHQRAFFEIDEVKVDLFFTQTKPLGAN